MSNRVNARLYKIKDIVSENVDTSDFVQQMIQEYNQDSGNMFTQVPLRGDLSDQAYGEKLFIFRKPEKEPTWIEFLQDIVINDNVLSDLTIKNVSFILFVFTTNRIYAITKGYFGRHIIKKYIDERFGLDVLRRLINKNSTEIRKIEQRGIFGSELSAERFFRENYSLSYEDDFGLIYRNLLASIDEVDFKKLGIIKKREDISKVSINGSSYLQISTNFDYSELIDRIEKIEKLLKSSEGIQLNQFNRLSVAELSIIKDKLNNEILKLALKAYKEKESIDFYHPDISEYLNATEVSFDVKGDTEIIPLGHSFGFIPIMERLVKKNKIDVSSDVAFFESLKECRGSFIVEDGEAHDNYRSLTEWVSGEVEFDGRKYFRYDNLWYTFEDTFDSHLNKYFTDLDFESLKPSHALKKWEKKYGKERQYNNSFIKEEGFIVADEVTLDFLELADLIRITEDKIYLYHVKKGLGRDLRVLTNQVINAARKIRSIIAEIDDDALKKYYKKIKKEKYKGEEIYIQQGGKRKIISEDDFLGLFKKNKLAFVFAYSSDSTKKVEEEINSTKSRIAKLSILYCVKGMRVTDFEFLIERIPLL
jgi:uncharacterized protein (TIGR04141 family)